MDFNGMILRFQRKVKQVAEPASSCTSLILVMEVREDEKFSWQRERRSWPVNGHSLGLSFDVSDSSSG